MNNGSLPIFPSPGQPFWTELYVTFQEPKMGVRPFSHRMQFATVPLPSNAAPPVSLELLANVQLIKDTLELDLIAPPLVARLLLNRQLMKRDGELRYAAPPS